MPNFRAIKNSSGATRPGYAGTITNLQNVWNTPKKSLLKSSHPQSTCQNFPTQRNPEIENFEPKKSFDHPCHLKSGVPPPPRVCFSTVLTWPLDSSMSALWLVSHADVLKGSSRVPAPLTSAKFRKVQSALVRSGSLLRLSTFFPLKSADVSGVGTRDERLRTSAWEATLWLSWQ